MMLTEEQCGHEAVCKCGHPDGEIYDADCFYCPDCGELVEYETGEVRVVGRLEYEEYECPGRSCAKYLYGMGHGHQRVKLD